MGPSVAPVIGALLAVTFLSPECRAADPDVKGLQLCGVLRRGMKDYSYHNLTAVPSHLPHDTQYLDISHNPIPRLDADQFFGLSQLCFLKATHCGLREIPSLVFKHTPGLKVLNISHNSLPYIPAISLEKLQVFALDNNLYSSYKIPASFQDMKGLDSLLLGSTAATMVGFQDFDALTNVSLKHLLLGAGTPWRKYDSGSLARINLQEISLHVSFCENFTMLEDLLRDLAETRVRSIQLRSVFPDSCRVTGDPFFKLRTMPFIQRLSIENTWINSSFMEVFLKNVWFSPLRELLFVNITYNEDTPDGFQFPTINSTINLRSVTFNGVNHYQYKYPTFNMSFKAFSELTYLKFSGTGMNILPCGVISTLPSLEMLDLSDNLLSESGFWWFQCSYSSTFPKLQKLSLSRNRFTSLSFISKKMQQMKTLKSLDLSFNSIHLDGACSWPAQLTELSLGNNNLGNTVFNYLSPNFESIDLTKTGITALTQEVLSRFPKLEQLTLSSNNIQVFPEDLIAPTLLRLHVDQNAITSVSREAFAGLPRLQTLIAGNNPYFCSCDMHWFITTLNKSLLPDWPFDYTCSTPPSLSGQSLLEYKTSRLSCEVWLQVVVALPVLTALCTALGVIFCKCDGVWYTRMLWTWIRMKRRGMKRSNLLKNASFSYHAFISYSHQDSDWVDSQLVPSLEGNGFSLCIHERDFVPGEWILDNIINCVESSYKTLFVLSKHFVKSEWCNYELFFAQHRSISTQRDSIVFVLLEPIPADSLPKKFLRLRSLLEQQTYLEWPSDQRKQQVFWASLKSLLHMADKAVVLKDVAHDLLERVPLLTEQTEQF
ncbi:toll-like receptor 1 isoform X2 [Oryzias melastigma]|uniref:toll-like receptor 1 isoform X2 n=1 Tax=Oryzias melastigma TaxID=30732 RepID=UPI000CF7F20A|nr:toll-like receptor 1 isoform X2 [Oryzias melastigma]